MCVMLIGMFIILLNKWVGYRCFNFLDFLILLYILIYNLFVFDV